MIAYPDNLSAKLNKNTRIVKTYEDAIMMGNLTDKRTLIYSHSSFWKDSIIKPNGNALGW
jgi:hypothetical protein